MIHSFLSFPLSTARPESPHTSPVTGRGAEPPAGALISQGPLAAAGEDRHDLVSPDIVSTGVYERDVAMTPEGDELYYISFRNADDTWTGPINLGEKVNTESRLEYSPYVSPDGRYFFFMAARHRFEDAAADPPLTVGDVARLHAEPRNGLPDIWWIDAGFLEGLRPAGP